MSNGVSTERVNMLKYICPGCCEVMDKMQQPDHWGCRHCGLKIEQLNLLEAEDHGEDNKYQGNKKS